MHALLMEEGMPEDGMEEDNEDFAATRFVEGEMLDSSVYGIQSPRVVYQSGTELLAILYAHLRVAADVGGMECSSIVWRSEEYKMDREGLNDDSIVERARRRHVEKLYRQQQKDCATILGMLCLDPRHVYLGRCRSVDVASARPMLPFFASATLIFMQS